jgi:methylmalonyl-CoA mutase N-terminal domain/subunit
MREAGCTAVQELAFTLSNGKAYVQAALERGLDINVFGRRLSFFFNGHNNLFEEVAKFRAARRMWAHTMKALGATDARAQMLRFHTQTGGSTLTAQQPHNNIARVSIQALAAVLGGTQSLHTNGYDEALSLPTEEAARIALRTQQIIAHESGVADTVDPLAGSWFVESLTDELEKRALEYMQKIDAMGGAVSAIEMGYMQDEIARSAYEHQKRVEAGSQIIVGVNQFADDDEKTPEVATISDEVRQAQSAKLAAVRAERHQPTCDAVIDRLKAKAATSENLIPTVIEAVESLCTLGEIADALRDVWGEHR